MSGQASLVGLDRCRSSAAEKSCRSHGGDGHTPMVALLGIGRLWSYRLIRDIPAGSISLDGTGRHLPTFGCGQAVGQRAEQIGDVPG